MSREVGPRVHGVLGRAATSARRMPLPLQEFHEEVGAHTALVRFHIRGPFCLLSRQTFLATILPSAIREWHTKTIAYFI